MMMMMMKMQFFSPIKRTDRRADFAIAFWHLKGYCKWLIAETVAAKFNGKCQLHVPSLMAGIRPVVYSQVQNLNGFDALPIVNTASFHHLINF